MHIVIRSVRFRQLTLNESYLKVGQENESYLDSTWQIRNKSIVRENRFKYDLTRESFHSDLRFRNFSTLRFRSYNFVEYLFSPFFSFFPSLSGIGQDAREWSIVV